MLFFFHRSHASIDNFLVRILLGKSIFLAPAGSLTEEHFSQVKHATAYPTCYTIAHTLLLICTLPLLCCLSCLFPLLCCLYYILPLLCCLYSTLPLFCCLYSTLPSFCCLYSSFVLLHILYLCSAAYTLLYLCSAAYTLLYLYSTLPLFCAYIILFLCSAAYTILSHPLLAFETVFMSSLLFHSGTASASRHGLLNHFRGMKDTLSHRYICLEKNL